MPRLPRGSGRPGGPTLLRCVAARAAEISRRLIKKYDTAVRCSYGNLGSGILSALAVFSIDRSSELLLTPQSLRKQTQPPNGGHPHSLWLVHQQESMGRLPAAAALWVDRDPITSDHW